MEPPGDHFQRSIREQIAINRARTPTERLLEASRLLDEEYEAAKHDPEIRARIDRRLAEAERGREEFRAHLKRMMATGFADPFPPDFESACDVKMPAGP
jgi:hypothetical protein